VQCLTTRPLHQQHSKRDDATPQGVRGSTCTVPDKEPAAAAAALKAGALSAEELNRSSSSSSGTRSATMHLRNARGSVISRRVHRSSSRSTRSALMQLYKV
jgi:hypothetical protein